MKRLLATTTVIVLALASSAQAQLGWLTDGIDTAAKKRMRLLACTKQLYPGLTGEKFEAAMREVDVQWTVAENMLERKVDYCRLTEAIRRMIKEGSR